MSFEENRLRDFVAAWSHAISMRPSAERYDLSALLTLANGFRPHGVALLQLSGIYCRIHRIAPGISKKTGSKMRTTVIYSMRGTARYTQGERILFAGYRRIRTRLS